LSQLTIKNRTILQGDVLEKLTDISNESIDVIITSPPYWGLRDYGVDGQIGLEPDFRDYLKIMEKIMDQLKRVLKNTGSCWINLGDTYNGTGDHTYELSDNEIKWKTGPKKIKLDSLPHKTKSYFIKNIGRKSRFGIPERFYINCIDEGWIARNHIPWYKSNSMPSSVKDRFTNKWESIFFFVKSQKYYFNLDAVREKTVTESKPFNIRVRENITGHAQAKLGDKSWTATEEEKSTHNSKGEKLSPYYKAMLKQKPLGKQYGGQTGLIKKEWQNKQDSTLGADGKPIPTYKGFNKRWKDRNDEQCAATRTEFSWIG